MNNEFRTMMTNLDQMYGGDLQRCRTLQQVKETLEDIMNFEYQIEDWITETQDENEKANYSRMYLERHNKQESPNFDRFFNVEESYDEYEGYYQRFGCVGPESIYSWDSENFLFDDGSGNMDIAMRPDVLMNLSA